MPVCAIRKQPSRRAYHQGVGNWLEVTLRLRLHANMTVERLDAGVLQREELIPIMKAASTGWGWPSSSGQRSPWRTQRLRSSKCRTMASQTSFVEVQLSASLGD